MKMEEKQSPPHQTNQVLVWEPLNIKGVEDDVNFWRGAFRLMSVESR